MASAEAGRVCRDPHTFYVRMVGGLFFSRHPHLPSPPPHPPPKVAETKRLSQGLHKGLKCVNVISSNCSIQLDGSASEKCNPHDGAKT